MVVEEAAAAKEAGALEVEVVEVVVEVVVVEEEEDVAMETTMGAKFRAWRRRVWRDVVARVSALCRGAGWQ
jgi:hypothetical protein